MSIRVYQTKDDWTPGELYALSYDESTDDREKNRLARAQFLAGRYMLAAVVETERLEFALRLTQNIDHPWSRISHPLVQVMLPLPQFNGLVYGLKSTTVGDVCVLDHELHRLSRSGWQSCGPVTQEEMIPPPRTARAWAIDPGNRVVYGVTISDSNSLKEQLGNDIDAVAVFANGDVLLTDRECLQNNPQHFFVVDIRSDYPLAGHALLIGPEIYDPETGATLGRTDVRTSDSELVRRLTALTREQVLARARANASEVLMEVINPLTGESDDTVTIGTLFGVGPRQLHRHR